MVHRVFKPTSNRTILQGLVVCLQGHSKPTGIFRRTTPIESRNVIIIFQSRTSILLQRVSFCSAPADKCIPVFKPMMKESAVTKQPRHCCTNDPRSAVSVAGLVAASPSRSSHILIIPAVSRDYINDYCVLMSAQAGDVRGCAVISPLSLNTVIDGRTRQTAQ